MTELLLIRHGTVPGNLEKRYVGSTDESLTEEGACVIREKKKTGLYPAADIVFSSPLKRCLETAAIIWPEASPVTVDAWSEIRFGDFEYKNYKELSGDPRYQAWIDSGGTLPFPGGESMDSYRERVLDGFREVCSKLSEYERSRMKTDRPGAEETEAAARVRAGAAVHFGTIRALVSALTDRDYFDINIKNGEGYLLTIAGDGTVAAVPFPGE